MEIKYTINREYENFFEIKKSKFYTFLFPIKSIRDFEQKLENVKKDNKKATHFVTCYSIQSEGELYLKCDDDGEPTGTAGKPILQVINKLNLVNVGLIVVRYFGGIKLGSGGLIRSYSKCASEIIKTIDLHQIINYYHFELKFSNKNFALIDEIKQNKYIENLDIVYDNDILVKGKIPIDKKSFIDDYRRKNG